MKKNKKPCKRQLLCEIEEERGTSDICKILSVSHSRTSESERGRGGGDSILLCTHDCGQHMSYATVQVRLWSITTASAQSAAEPDADIDVHVVYLKCMTVFVIPSWTVLT